MLLISGNAGNFTYGAPIPGHRYWRFKFSTGHHDHFSSLQEMEFHDLSGDIASLATITSLASFNASSTVDKLTDGDLTTEPGLMNFNNSGAPRWVDFDFGTNKALHHLRVHDRADNGGAYSEGWTNRAIGVYYSDDGINYTLYFVGYHTPSVTPTWHTINTPEVAGVSADAANLWTGLYAQNSVNGQGNYTIRELEYLSSAVVKVGASALPVSNIQSSRYNNLASLDVSKVFSGSTARWNSEIATPQCVQLLAHEMATPMIIDQIKLTSTEYPNSMVQDFALVTGDGTTFVPLLEVTGEVGWTTGEVRSFTV